MEPVSGLTLLIGPRLAQPGATGGFSGDTGAGSRMAAAQLRASCSAWGRPTITCAAAAAASTFPLSGTRSAVLLVSESAGDVIAGDAAEDPGCAACLCN